MPSVLLVDDEPDFVAGACELLELHGFEVDTAESLSEARAALKRSRHDVLLLDLLLPDGNGLELLDDVPADSFGRVVLITGHPGITSHIRHFAGPSISYLTKPVGSEDLIKELRGAGEDARQPSLGSHFGLIVGEHTTMRALYDSIEKVAVTDSPVFVTGETGTGKELVAEAIHQASGRSGEFVPVNCGSLSHDLAGSELFGHEKGSFTGAVRRHTGFLRRAQGGTLFLDELTEMPLKLQPHFLRAIERQRVLPVGGEREFSVDVRIVAATNRDPQESIEAGFLREDLFFRLNVFPLRIPPLRERRSDVPLLVTHFIRQLTTNGVQRTFTEDALKRLQAYDWPGNVRELRHVVQRALIMSDAGAEHLELPERFDSPFAAATEHHVIEAGRTIRDVERELIQRTLEHFDGDKKAAAATLGISLSTLYNRLNLYENR